MLSYLEVPSMVVVEGLEKVFWVRDVWHQLKLLLRKPDTDKEWKENENNEITFRAQRCCVSSDKLISFFGGKS